MDLGIIKALSLGYLLGLLTLTLASLLWRAWRPRLAPWQRADAGFAIILGTFATTTLLSLAIWIGAARGLIYMSTWYFSDLMMGGWDKGITAAGIAVMAASLLLALRAWLRGRTPSPESHPLAVTSGLAVVANNAISTAGLVGCWRPAVWVNPAYWEQLTDAQRALALEHERTHLRRRDNLRKLLLQFVAALYAVLPASRRWTAQYELDCELAVDDRCRRELDSRAYTELLAHSTQFALAGRAVASGMSQADLRQRLELLAAPPALGTPWASALVAVLLLVAVAPAAGLLAHPVSRCLLACYLGY